jgi:nucleoside phosphorylase
LITSHSESHAQALVRHVDCVVCILGNISDDGARTFSADFYGGLGDGASIAAAFRQGCAALALDNRSDREAPQLVVRDGIDADTLVLVTESILHVARPEEATPSSILPIHRTPQPRTAPDETRRVDIGIITIRDDEFRAVLAAFPAEPRIHKGKRREYALRQANAGNEQHYTVAVVRQIEQGNGEAQDAARDLIDDLAPTLLLVVGIAGGVPSDDVKLGDVVISTRIQDFTISAHKAGQDPTYAATGGPVAKELAAAIANLPAREGELGEWTSTLPNPPDLEWTQPGQLYGPPDWQSDLQVKLKHHYGTSGTPRSPAYVAGPIASSDRLVKDPELVIPWLMTNRNLLAVEMESGGVFRAVRDRCPMLAIRGISDLVGLKRADAWTKYACASAAAFTRAFLRTRPVQLAKR